MTPISQLLRLLLLLLTPVWLSLAVDGLGLHGSMPSLLSNWRRAPAVDTTLAPPTGWRERAYLAANPDVAAAVRDGQISSGYAHYVQHGRAEGRSGGLIEPARPAAAPDPAPAEPQTIQPQAIQPQTIQTPAAPDQEVQDAPVPATKPEPQDGSPAPRTGPVTDIPRPGVKPVPEPPAATSMPAQAPAATATPQAPPLAAPRHVERIRTANGGEGVRVVLDLDGAPRFETPGRRPDGRLEVMLPGTLWQAAPSGRLPATALGYSVERSGAGTRLLFSDEDGGTDTGPVRLLAVSTLAPDKERGHRLVIDVALPSMAKAGRRGR